MCSKEIEESILEQVNGLQADIVAGLQAMIRYATVTPGLHESVRDDAFLRHQDWVQQFLEARGFQTERWDVDPHTLADAPGRGVIRQRPMDHMPVVVGRLAGSGGGRSLILNGHYDVVPEGDPDTWRFPPFSAAVSDGRVYGRGATDMKGGNAAMLFAVRAIQEAGYALKGDLTVQIVPDEELTCMGTLACCLAGFTADAAFIPEPTDMEVLIAMRGSVYGTVHVPGRSGHAEMAQPHWRMGGAVNAISKSARIIGALEDLAEVWHSHPERTHPYIGPDKLVMTRITGGEWEVTYPDSVAIRFGAMFAPGRTIPDAEIRAAVDSVSRLDAWLSENPPQLSFSPWYYGAEVDENEPVVKLAQDILSEMGYAPRLRGFGSLTDAIHLINVAGVPTISVGPGTDSMHAVDESVSIAELMDLVRLTALLIVRWCGVAERS